MFESLLTICFLTGILISIIFAKETTPTSSDPDSSQNFSPGVGKNIKIVYKTLNNRAILLKIGIMIEPSQENFLRLSLEKTAKNHFFMKIFNIEF